MPNSNPATKHLRRDKQGNRLVEPAAAKTKRAGWARRARETELTRTPRRCKQTPRTHKGTATLKNQENNF